MKNGQKIEVDGIRLLVELFLLPHFSWTHPYPDMGSAPG